MTIKQHSILNPNSSQKQPKNYNIIKSIALLGLSLTQTHAIIRTDFTAPCFGPCKFLPEDMTPTFKDNGNGGICKLSVNVLNATPLSKNEIPKKFEQTIQLNSDIEHTKIYRDPKTSYEFLVSHHEEGNGQCFKSGPNCWTSAGLLLEGYTGNQRDDSRIPEFVTISNFTCTLNS